MKQITFKVVVGTVKEGALTELKNENVFSDFFLYAMSLIAKNGGKKPEAGVKIPNWMYAEWHRAMYPDETEHWNNEGLFNVHAWWAEKRITLFIAKQD